MVMSFNTLSFVALPANARNNPLLNRRNKLLIQLEQQKALAEDPSYVAVSQKWRRQDDGSKRLIEKQKRVKKWWLTDMNGKCLLTLRYGAKLIDLDGKGKTAIAVGDMSNLVSTISTVIEAVRNGELDAYFSEVKRTASRTKAKAA